MFDPEDHPGLALLLLERWGELCHEIGDFPGSLAAHRRACDLSDRVLRSTTDPDHRLVEIEEARGFALFAAYAAARAGSPEEAVAFAERQRMRLQGDLLGAREVLAGPEPAEGVGVAGAGQIRPLWSYR